MNNINENICQAIDIIIQERLSHISFDTTVLCKVVDDSKKEQGIYIVKSDETKFEAYSSLQTLLNGDSVYVQIPNGDWNEQKFILSKKTSEDQNPSLTYRSPFSNFIDITGNLVNVNTNEYGLTANANDENLKEIEIWSYNSANQEEPLKGYSSLGIKAGFKTMLNSNVIKGNYGLRLKIVSKLDKLINSAGDNKLQGAEYTLELNEKNMNGNPYSFSTYANQEILFDISQIDNILSMSLVFYQKPGSFFIDKNNNTYALEVVSKKNLFVNNIGVFLGYRTDEITEEKVIIYSNDSSSYNKDATNQKDNNKKIKLRWIYKDPLTGTFRSAQPTDDINYEVRWYRYLLGAPSADEYSGIYWKLLSTQVWDNKDFKFKYEIKDDDWIKTENSAIKPDFLTSWIIPNTKSPSEKVKAVILYNNQIYRSEILEFTNENEVYSNEGILDEIQDTIKNMTALTIQCDDYSNGNYFIYDESYRLIDGSQSAIPRQFSAFLNLKNSTDNNGDDYPLENVKSITWYLPKSNTMLRFKDEDLINNDIEEYYGVEYYKITKYQQDNGKVENKLTYYINSRFSLSYVNNTIMCEVVDNNETIYNTTKTLSFGVSGSNGTDTTLVLDFATPGVNAVDLASTDYNIVVEANLYDANNQNITQQAISNKVSWTWEWVDQKNSKLVQDGSNNLCTILWTNNISDWEDKWHVLKCTVEGWGDYNLEALLPIPIKKSARVSGVEIPKENQINLSKNSILPIDYPETNNWTGYDFVQDNKIDFKKIYNSNFEWILNESNLGAYAHEKAWQKLKYIKIFYDNYSFNLTQRSLNTDGVSIRIKRNKISQLKPQKYKLSFQFKTLSIENNVPENVVIGEGKQIYSNFRFYLNINGIKVGYGPAGSSSASINITQFILDKTEYNPLKHLDNYVATKSILANSEWQTYELILNLTETINIEDNGITLRIIGGTQPLDLAPYAIKDIEFIQLTEDSVEPIVALSGPTEIIYNTEGNPQYYNNLFGLSYYFNNKLITNYYGNGLDWKIIPEGNGAYYPQLSAKKDVENNVVVGYRLQPNPFYVAESSTGVVLQALLNDDVVWAQPILILQNKYFSSSINKWDGSVQIDKEGGFIGSNKIAAGRKETDNTFTGVILGEYGTNSNELDVGLYGFSKGKATFGFKEDGTAFIGESGAGRIDFNGKGGIIQSGNWKLIENSWNLPEPQGEETTIGGTLFDLDDGKIILKRWKQEDVEDDDGNVSKQNVSYSITLDSQKNSKEYDYPLTIGTASNPNFKVKWDGSIEATNGKFTGIIDAKQGGTIGGWSINQDGLSKGGVTLGGDGYAFNAGAFTVGYDGTVVANKITTDGMTANNIDIQSGTITGVNLTLQGKSVSIFNTDGYGLTINEDGAQFNGDVEIANGSISFNQLNLSTQNKIDTASSNASGAINIANNASGQATLAQEIAEQIVSGTYNGGSFINNRLIYSPELHANDLYISTKRLDGSYTTSGTLYYMTSGGDYTPFSLTVNSADGSYSSVYLDCNTVHSSFTFDSIQFITIETFEESDSQTPSRMFISCKGNYSPYIFFDTHTVNFSECKRVILPSDTTGTTNIVAVFA